MLIHFLQRNSNCPEWIMASRLTNIITTGMHLPTQNIGSVADVVNSSETHAWCEGIHFILFERGRNLPAALALSATAEQSFSATKRLKTWLWSSTDKLALITLLFYMCTRTSTLTVLQSSHHLAKTTVNIFKFLEPFAMWSVWQSLCCSLHQLYNVSFTK